MKRKGVYKLYFHRDGKRIATLILYGDRELLNNLLETLENHMGWNYSLLNNEPDKKDVFYLVPQKIFEGEKNG